MAERCEACGERDQTVKIRGNDPRRICIPCGAKNLDFRTSTERGKKDDGYKGLKWPGAVGDPHDAGDPW